MQNFPDRGGDVSLQGGELTYYFAKYFPNTAWKWKNFDPGGRDLVASLTLDPPMIKLQQISKFETFKIQTYFDNNTFHTPI